MGGLGLTSPPPKRDREVMFDQLEAIYRRPRPFEFYTARELWTDEYTSAQMLAYHLDEEVDLASRSGAFIERSVEWIVSHLGVDEGRKIADFGCGPGLYTTLLARRGADVTGIDFSRRSIDHARETAAAEGLSIRYIHEDYLELELDARFDLIMMIMCDFCALGPEQRRTMLRKFRGLLAPGGAVLLDVYSLAAFAAREELSSCEMDLLDGFWSPRRYYGFLNTFKYDREKVVLDKYTLVEKARIRTIYNWLQYFSPESLERELNRCGLEVDERYADVAGATYNPEHTEFAVVARK
jgi:cyclopropane fatty-acyl-phospholipid synthase-like methyltransferase